MTDDAPIHDEILDNPVADEALAKIAIQRAMEEEGLTREEAEELYAVPSSGQSPEKPMSAERAIIIQMEETIPHRRNTPDLTQDEQVFRRAIRRDICRLKRVGLEIVVPNL